MSGVTSAEFLSIIPKKDKKDHERDMIEMKKITKKLKGVDLNPKMDLEEAVKAVKVIEDNLKKKHIQTHNLELTKEELKTVIQSIECFIDPRILRWSKDEADEVDIILLLNKFKDRFYGI